MRLIVTRPEPEAARTAAALTALGHTPILSPMLDILLDTSAPLPERPFQAVLATSGNAVRALAAHPAVGRLAVLPLLAVGDNTALLAKRAGFGARSAGGAVEDLAALIGAELSPGDGPLFYAAGDAQTGDLAGRLRSLGFEVQVAILYRSEPRRRLAGVAEEALRQGSAEGVLLYSRRSAAAFALALGTSGLTPLSAAVTCFCLSAAAAEPLAAVSQGPVLIADQPDQISLFVLIERALASAAGSPPGD